MKNVKIALIACASLLAFGVPSAVFAQTNAAPAASGPFADVPADHWAYQSVDTLQKAGIVIGYPDGTYGGKRAMTRYEFAVAIARLLPLLQNNDNYATKDDLAALRQDLEQKLQANSDAIDALQKLVDEFQPELEKLGQDVDAVKDRLDALESRVANIEEEQRRIKFTGALNLIAKAENVTKGSAFMDQNGFVDSGPLDTKKLLQTSDIYQDFVLGIRGKVSDTATANVKLDFGNYLSSIGNVDAFGGEPISGIGGNIYAAGFDSSSPGLLTADNQQMTVWEANLEMPVDLGPLGGADLVAGRFGQQWTKWTLEQVDADVYTQLYQLDSGNIPIDGAKVNLKIGPLGVDAFAGQTKAIPFAQPWGGNTGDLSTRGDQFDGLPGGLLPQNHAAEILQGAGARVSLGTWDNGVLAGTVEQFGLEGTPYEDDTHPDTPYGVLSVYGADYNGAVPFLVHTGLTLDLNWTDSADGYDSRSFNDIGNGWRYTSSDDEAALKIGSLQLKGGYQYVGPDFSAPGNWGKIGAWTNPTNIEGGLGSATFDVSHNITLSGSAASYQTAYAAEDSPLQQGDKVIKYQVGANVGLCSDTNLDLGYESDNWKLADSDSSTVGGPNLLIASGKPIESWVNLGLNHSLNSNASLRLLYQIAEYQDKGTGFDGTIGDFNGNVAEGQFSIKF
jgi:FtsZ-binding cell division protein ZapB